MFVTVRGLCLCRRLRVALFCRVCNLLTHFGVVVVFAFCVHRFLCIIITCDIYVVRIVCAFVFYVCGVELLLLRCCCSVCVYACVCVCLKLCYGQLAGGPSTA